MTARRATEEVDVLIVGAGPVGPDAGEHPWPAGCSDRHRRRARHPDRLPARRRTRRRVAAHLPVDRPGRARPAAHRAEPDPAFLRRQAPPARRDGTARRPIRLAQAQRLRPAAWSTPNCCAGSTASTTSRCGGAPGWRTASKTADGVTVEFGRRQTRVARPLRRRLRRRAQRHPPPDGRVVRRHHVADALAGRRRRQRSARPPQQRGRRRPGTGRTPRSRSRTESAASSS